MPRRFFTVEQANRALPEIVPLLERLQTGSAELARLQERLAELQRKALGNGHNRAGELSELRTQIEHTNDEAADIVARIQALGIELKDPAIGLIDFPSIHQGRRVLLCWKLGEPAVAFWHEVNTGYSGRQPIPGNRDS